MARTLSAPVTEQTITKQVITKISVDLAFTQSGSINLAESQMSYRVMNLPENQENGYRVVPGDEIPDAMKTAVRGVLNLCYIDADAQGLLNPGTDGDDI